MVSLLLMLSLLGTLLLPGFAAAENQPDFRGLNDPALLPYIEDTLYAQLVGTLNSEDYFVENVSAVYISQEYLEELAYNSQANVFFGFTLAELEAQFQGEKYIFRHGRPDLCGQLLLQSLQLLFQRFPALNLLPEGIDFFRREILLPALLLLRPAMIEVHPAVDCFLCD